MRLLPGIIFYVILQWVSVLVAEDLLIHNLSFQYQTAETKDPKVLKLTIGKKSSVVAKDQLKTHLVKNIDLQEQKYSSEDLLNFWFNILEHQEKEYLPTVFIQLSKSKLSRLENYQLFSALSDEYIQILSEQKLDLQTLDPDFQQFYILYFKDYLSSEVIDETVQIETLEEIARTLLQESINPVEVGDIFSPLSENDEFKRLFKFLELYQLSLNKAKTLLRNYAHLSKDYKEYFSLMKEPLEEARKKHIQNSLEAKQVKQALDLILLKKFSERTEHTHKFMLAAISALQPKDLKILRSAEYKDPLLEYAQKDPLIKEALIKAVEIKVKHALDTDAISETFENLKLLVQLRPNPHPDNVNLSFDLIKKLDSKNYKVDAYSLFQENKGYYSTEQKIWLFLNSYYLNFKVFFCCILLILILTFYLYRYSNNFVKERKQKNMNSSFRPESEAEAGQTIDKHNALNPRKKQYEAMLKDFGITDEVVSADQIKKVYRKKVKSFHPDLNPDQTEKEHDEFIRLTKAYESLLKLHDEFKDD